MPAVLEVARWEDAITDPPRPDPAELFADLPVGDNGERFDFGQSPWVRAVLDWWLDERVEWIYLLQGSQTSKTTTMMGLALYAARYDPAPAMWVCAIEEETDKFVTQRLKPFLETADPAVKTRRKVDWRKTDMRLYGRMLVHFAWSTSGKKLRSWPCRYLFGDEVGAWPASLPGIGDPLEFTRKRTRRYRNRKGIFGTTPSTEYHPSWQAAKAAAFARWYVPCPECGEFQFLDFDRLRFEHCKDESGWNLERVIRETFYECEHCAAHLADAHKPNMILAGRLQYVDPDTWQPVEDPPAGHSARTLQIPATYSLFTPWGRLAAMLLEAKSKGPEALRVFVTDELAMPWVEQADRPEAHALVACIDAERAPGTVPEGTVALTAGVDLQKEWIYYAIRAWGLAGRSWGIRHGRLPRRDEREPLDILDEVLTTDYQGYPVAMTFIDSGYLPELVYNYCATRGRHIAPSKGASSDRADLVRTSALERWAGRPVAGGLTLYLLNSSYWKSAIHERVTVTRGDPREWRLHGETGEDYCRQILAEARVRKVERGIERWEWVLIDKSAGNHWLDCEALAMAAAWYPVRVHAYTSAPPRPEVAAGAEPTREPTPEESRQPPDRWTVKSLAGYL